MTIYLDEINNYFKLKESYNDKLNQEKQKIINNKDLTAKEKRQKYQQYKKKCINCKKVGGTIFTQKDNMFKAYCGNIEKPCNLNISINREKKILMDEKLLDYITIIDSIKKQIIITKLDYVFNYTIEDESIQKFNELKKNLNDLTDNYNSLYTQYINIIHNLDKNDIIMTKLINRAELIESIKSRISLFNTTNNIKYIKECAEMFITDLSVLNKELRELHYNIINIEKIDDKFHLVKDIYTLKELEIDIRE